MSKGKSGSQYTKAMNDVLRLMADGYILLQEVTYDDREAPYRLVPEFGMAYWETIHRGLAQKIIASGKVETKHSGPWRRWKLRK